MGKHMTHNLTAETLRSMTTTPEQLITAAPDLLIAAIAMRKINHDSTRADVDRACDMLDAAIKKAGAA
jgi:hypothetical protein